MVRDGASHRAIQPASFADPPLNVLFKTQLPYAAGDIFKPEISAKERRIFRSKKHYLSDALPKVAAGATEADDPVLA
jgi:hypothetical protein